MMMIKSINKLLLLALTGSGPALVAALPQSASGQSQLSTPLSTTTSGNKPTGTSISAGPTSHKALTNILDFVGTGCIGSTGTGLSACLATQVPVWLNGTSTSIFTTSTTPSAPVPTGTWNDGAGDLAATNISVTILPGTKQVLIQTWQVNGNSVPFTNLKCPNDGDDFENPAGSKDILPWYLLIHGGNVCKGSIKPGAGFDDCWIKYSNLGQINVPTDSRCSSMGSAMRCVFPLDPTKR